MQRVDWRPAALTTCRAISRAACASACRSRNLVTRPRLVLMDEPTSGLDVSVQARLLDLIRLLVSRLQLSVVIVTHDLGVARLLAQRTLVMQRGRIVEHGLTDRCWTTRSMPIRSFSLHRHSHEPGPSSGRPR